MPSARMRRSSASPSMAGMRRSSTTQVGPLLAQHREHFVGVGQRGQHVHAAADAQQVRQAAAAQRVVVDEHDAGRGHQCLLRPGRDSARQREGQPHAGAAAVAGADLERAAEAARALDA